MIMKKTIFISLATCGLLLSSCSSNDVFEDNQGTNNPNVINFSATTTRATINNLTNVKGGFPVYANWLGSTNAWHINGIIYKFGTNSWGWDLAANAPQWPAVDINKKIHFYAYYPADNTTEGNPDGFTPNAETVGTLTGAFTINPTAATQIDFLAANTPNIERVPQGGSVPLAFKHITTKINFGVIAAEGTKSYIQQMNINNVKNTGTYDYVAPGDQDAVVKNWTSTDFTTIKPAYDYFGTTTVDKTPKKTHEFTATESSFYSANHNNHLMLLPQKETAVWVPVKQTSVSYTPDEAYIGSVYRMTSADGNTDLVGYSDASKHPNYNDLPENSTWKSYKGPLFVKVGFPLAPKTDQIPNPTFSWTMGKAYTYNIMLGQNGSTGGYILDEHYYDENGNPTDLTINGKKPGEPVSGGTINFDVTVGDWGTDENTSVEGPQS